MAINQRNERTQKAERDSRDFRTRTVAETRMKRDNTFREKRGQNKKISLAFSLSLSLQSFLVHTAFGRRYESYLINLFLLQEERFHDERRREKGKFRSYYIYIIASSSNRFPRFRRSVLRVRVRVREREHVWICLFSPPPKEEAEEDKEVLIR